MPTGFRAFAVLGLILGLLSLAGCAVEAIPAPAPGAPPAATAAATLAAVAGTSATPGPAASATPVPSATAQATAVAGAGGGVVVSSPVAAGSSGPLGSLTPAPAAGGIILTPVNGQLTVTLADNGATVRLHPGDRFVMMLGEAYDWQVTPADPNVVSRVVNITTVRGSQGVYEAHRAGQTTIEATGDPACRQSKPPCMMPSIAFTLNVVVE